MGGGSIISKLETENDRAEYTRFHIETKTAPPMFEVPNKFDVHAKRIRLAAMLVHEAFNYRFNREVVLSRPCIYGVFGGRLGGFKPIKDRCVGCMRCVQEYPHIMTVQKSDQYRKLGNASWTPESVFTIYYEAMTGKIPVKGMGYKGSFGGEGWDGIWTDMSEIVRPTRDGVYGREYISTIVDIGRKPSFLNFSKPEMDNSTMKLVQSPLPVMFDNIPENATNRSVDMAISKAANRLGIYHASTRPTASSNPSQLTIPIVNRDNVDILKETLDSARIIELDLDSVDSSIASQIREEHPSLLVSGRVRLDDDADEEASRLVRTENVDIVHLHADHHGRDYSASPRHASQALRKVHTRLVEERLRDLTTLIVSGGITLAEHVPKAIICGADMVGLDTTLLVALQSTFDPYSGSNRDVGLCPRERVDTEWGSQRLVNLMASWHDQLIEILSAMGMRDVRRLRGDIGRSMTDAELREQSFQEIEKVT